MIERIIEYSIRNKFFVILVTGVIIAGGVYSMLNIPLDAIPDLSDTQVADLTAFLHALTGEFPQQPLPHLPPTPGRSIVN